MVQEHEPRFPLETRPAADMTQQKPSEPMIPNDSIDPRLLSLAMGFVPRQIWETPFDNETAFARGTIFPALDKPWMGWKTAKMRKEGTR